MTGDNDAAPVTTAAGSAARRRVGLVRTAKGAMLATNVRGGTVSVGNGADDAFTPVELLLAAIGSCSGLDVDAITSKRAEPTRFEVAVSAAKIRDEHGNRLVDIVLDFDIAFPSTTEGAAADAVLERAAIASHDRLCTVSRTVEVPSPIGVTVNGHPLEVAHRT